MYTLPGAEDASFILTYELMTLVNYDGYIQLILDIDNSRDIYMTGREARDDLHNGVECTKYSYHFTVDGIRISPIVLKKRNLFFLFFFFSNLQLQLMVLEYHQLY